MTEEKKSFIELVYDHPVITTSFIFLIGCFMVWIVAVGTGGHVDPMISINWECVK